MTEQNATDPTVESLLDGIEEMIEKAEHAVEGHEPAEETIEHLDDIHDVADSVEDLLGTVDLTELLGEINWSELPDAIKLTDVPDAIEDRNPLAAVRLRKLLSVTDMTDVWENVDAREFWRQSRELDDDMDDFDDEEDASEEGVFEDYSLDSPFSDDDDGDSDDGLFFSDSDDDDSASSETSNDSLEGLGPSDDGFAPESLENAIQSRISDSVQEFRESILDARRRLKQNLAENRDKSDRRESKETNSRNPTAVSTLPSRDSGAGRATFSTVPEETRYSTAPNRRRIYGSRFEDGEDDV